MIATALDHRLDRTLVIGAPQSAVFRYFTDPVRWAAWWGKGSTIDGRPGGRVFIRYPEGTEALGEVIEIDAPHRIVFSYGYASGAPVAPGGSRVTIRLEAVPRGTRVHLVHEFADASVRDEHVQGWRYQLSLFANVVANELHGDAAARADAWFAMWSDTADASRAATLAGLAAPAISLRDRFSAVDGIDDLTRHIAAAHKFMPGLRLQRDGEARHCQGTLIADWIAVGADGQPRGRGTNVFTLGPDGKVETVTGFWS